MSRPLVRWVVPDAGETLAELALRLGARDAVAEGRLFVDGRRAGDPDLRVAAGSVVEVHAARDGAAPITILGEHGGLVFVSKPAGVATEPDHAGVAASLVARVETELGLARGALHAVSRLDVGVSGVVTLARDEHGRELAARLRARGGFRRRYVALAPRAPEPPSGSWTWALPRKLRGASGRGAAHGAGESERAAETAYATVAEAGSVYLPERSRTRVPVRPALLALSPVTGRTHQLRLHAERAGTPLFGDAEHGGALRVILADGSVHALERVLLHAAWVELAGERERFHVEAPPPADFRALWTKLGGAAEAWTRAVEIALPDVRS
ncbi:MAG TPA: pseudouridine synthase [Polyangiaceae bacterium]|nr:pseudouridine synthase [Polyangiaceae bacterium]